MEINPSDGNALKGAECIMVESTFASMPALIKERPPKPYRPHELDSRIRHERTRAEAKLLHKAKLSHVPCPAVFAVGKCSITMGRLDGKTLNRFEPGLIGKETWHMAGKYLARLHKSGLIHGDYTPANLMLSRGGKLYVIDFGLGSFSQDIEDYAVDVLTMKNSLQRLARAQFLAGYSSEGDKKVLKHVLAVAARARYAER